jgi:hypothetical protein
MAGKVDPSPAQALPLLLQVLAVILTLSLSKGKDPEETTRQWSFESFNPYLSDSRLGD